MPNILPRIGNFIVVPRLDDRTVGRGGEREGRRMENQRMTSFSLCRCAT